MTQIRVLAIGIALATSSWAWLGTAAAAPIVAPPPLGYVVQTDPGLVYLDLGQSKGAKVGQAFTVFIEKGDLKHPVTGESLGPVEAVVASGRIQQVRPKYSVGRILSMEPEIQVAVGQRVRLLAAENSQPPGGSGVLADPAPNSGPLDTRSSIPPGPAAVSDSAGSQGPATPESATRKPIWRSPLIDLEAVAMAVGDVDGDGAPDLIVADADRVEAYPLSGKDWKTICSFRDKNTGVRFLSMDAADLDKDGKVEVYVALHNSFLGRAETLVLECRQTGFAKLATIPWMTRSFQDETGGWRLAGQQLIEDPTFSFGNIYPVEWRDGRHVQASPALRLKRLEWLYGFSIIHAAAGDPSHLFYTPTNYIRVQFNKKPWLTPETYGQTSSRLRWYDKHLMFYPRMVAVRSGQDLAAVYTLKNIPSLGALSHAFGVYGNSQIHKLLWTGSSLEPEWKADLGGYAADLTALYPPAGRSSGGSGTQPTELAVASQGSGGSDTQPTELLVAVVSGGGKTSILKFNP